MPSPPTQNRLSHWVRIAAILLVLKTTIAIVIGYVDYWPPNFQNDFLRGRDGYFFGWYQVAFYVHIVSGPITLLVGTLLVSSGFRRRWPLWHRRLGRVQGVAVLLLVTPSGLAMAARPQSGVIAGVSLAVLALATGYCTAAGWRAAVRRRFADHGRWMMRSYTLLCSAVVLRILGGTATVMEWDNDWINPAITWASWVGPLLAVEVWMRRST